jgi:hypothetical protein
MAEATSAEPGSTGGRSRTFIRVVIEIVIGAIVVIDALEELSSTRRRISRAFTGWWGTVERRERRHMHENEIAFLAKTLKRH